MKIIYIHNGEETNIRDPRSYEQYWITRACPIYVLFSRYEQNLYLRTLVRK